jgi:DNA-binding MarR family transcriptional regulator
MSDGVDDTVRSAFGLVQAYAAVTERSFAEVALEYAFLLRPMPSNREGKIRYLETLSKILGDLATHYESPLFESRGNQRKLLILSYFLERGYATSFDVSSGLKMSLTNVSERLRRYYKQGLLTRKPVERKRRGRRTMAYELTKDGRRRLALLIRTVKFRGAETNESKKYRSRQLIVEKRCRGRKASRFSCLRRC